MDPGKLYLYNQQDSASAVRRLPPRPRESNAQSEPKIEVNAGDGAERGPDSEPSTSNGAAGSNGTQSDWSTAAGHMENAKVALDQLRSLIDDAVFLDEDTFSGMKTLSFYHQKLQTAQKRIKALSTQILASQAQLARKDDQIREERELRKAVEKKIEQYQGELENNQVVFKMHYNEIIQRNEEIERLKAVIEGLGGLI